MQTLLDLGHALSARRRKLGLKQGDVARQAGLAQETLSRLELAVLSVLGMELAFAESVPSGSLDDLRRERGGQQGFGAGEG
ncbi:hypothetical protein GCM10007164_21830 [Luteimonas padinae]|uniref:Helix-turn-helix domain-containing protein n=1 Tax=Luteimonas padinae TaxID=1714359 RepID=A0ABV6SVH5_9GAMM|nr:helix-turn-helix domain-containing protein [Luteimonas padinae]GHD73207.1 hypothetical protein GCM10007164_21830 [Luteimonas padinae]